jgi:hypothetical protein
MRRAHWSNRLPPCSTSTDGFDLFRYPFIHAGEHAMDYRDDTDPDAGLAVISWVCLCLVFIAMIASALGLFWLG